MVSVSIACLVCAVLTRVGAESTLPFRELVVFGDSLTDDGSHGAYKLSEGTWPPSEYFEGRFSDGPTWSERTAAALDLSLRNYAVGGATSDNDLVQGRTGQGLSINSPSLVEQVDHYLERERNSNHPHTSVFGIMIGLNDLYFKPDVQASQTAEKISVVIDRLRGHTAYAFLIGVPYSLAATPYGQMQSNEDIARMDDYIDKLRREITKMKIRLNSREHKLRVAVLDVYAISRRIFADPQRYGFDPALTHKRCLVGVYTDEPRSLCSNPERFMFFDDFHPSSRLHLEIAKDAASTIRRRMATLGWNWDGW